MGHTDTGRGWGVEQVAEKTWQGIGVRPLDSLAAYPLTDDCTAVMLGSGGGGGVREKTAVNLRQHSKN